MIHAGIVRCEVWDVEEALDHAILRRAVGRESPKAGCDILEV